VTAPVRGFLLGKFMPPHAGHQYLCDMAAGLCDELTILVCSLERESIPGVLRHEWMSALYPKARVLHCDRDMPQEPADDPQFWDIWRALIASVHPEPIDRVFASERYGERLASELGARFWPVDIDRVCAPVSGTQIRRSPGRYWERIAPPARPWFTRTVVLHGPESTGKSTLAARLATRFGGACVPEFGRAWCELYGVDCSAQDLIDIADGQTAAIAAAVDLLGEDHVSLGSDYDGSVETHFDASELAALTHEMLASGWSEDRIVKLMGGNMMRVLAQVLPD
jgi:NadR type nicotinamide-nucleotide adenylyltransferase